MLNRNRMIDYFKKPEIIAIVANVNEGKSNLIYHIIEELKKEYVFNLATFGLRFKLSGAREINSLDQLEETRDSIIFIDEFYSLFDLEDRKKKRQIEQTLRLINHNNNILVLAGTPENFKKFISSKINVVFFKKVKIADFINGSSMKGLITNYEGYGIGAKMLNLRVNETLVYDGDYKLFDVPYMKENDSKRDNKNIFVEKKSAENVETQNGF